MKKVYLVDYQSGAYEPSQIVGIYSTEEKAKEGIVKFQSQDRHLPEDDFLILEYEVDKTKL